MHITRFFTSIHAPLWVYRLVLEPVRYYCCNSLVYMAVLPARDHPWLSEKCHLRRFARPGDAVFMYVYVCICVHPWLSEKCHLGRFACPDTCVCCVYVCMGKHAAAQDISCLSGRCHQRRFEHRDDAVFMCVCVYVYVCGTSPPMHIREMQSTEICTSRGCYIYVFSVHTYVCVCVYVYMYVYMCVYVLRRRSTSESESQYAHVCINICI